MSLKKAQKDAKRKKKKAAAGQKKANSAYFGPNFHFGEEEETTVDMWFGFSSPESAARNSDEDPTILCMACDINHDNLTYFTELYSDRFKLGDWYIAAGNCENKELHGPFIKMEEALEFGREQYGANHYRFGGW